MSSSTTTRRTTKFAARRELVECLRALDGLRGLGVAVHHAPPIDLTMADHVWLGPSLTDDTKDPLGQGGPNATVRLQETYVIEIGVFTGGHANEVDAEERAEGIVGIIEEWLSSAGGKTLEDRVPGLQWAVVSYDNIEETAPVKDSGYFCKCDIGLRCRAVLR